MEIQDHIVDFKMENMKLQISKSSYVCGEARYCERLLILSGGGCLVKAAAIS